MFRLTRFASKSFASRKYFSTECITLVNGVKHWLKNGELGRDDDLPTIETPDGRKYYYYHDKGFHRENGPAIVSPNINVWAINNKHHRDDGPAIVTPSYSEWYVNGVRHREDGPAFVSEGLERWYLNGEIHREGGPAVSILSLATCPPNRDLFWYKNGKLHREDGPAVIYSWGVSEWYLDGVRQV